MPKRVDHKSRREVFLAAAHRTVRKKGVAAATVREVAKEAGYTTGALVHYVDSMDDLLVEASENIAQHVRRDLTALESLPDRLEALRQVLHLTLPSDTERKGNWDFLIGLWERAAVDPAVRKRMQARVARWHRRTTRLIRAAQQAGDITAEVNPRRATRAIAAMIDGLALQVLRTGKPMTPNEQHVLIDRWIVNWLKPRRALGGGPVIARRTRTPQDGEPNLKH